MEKQKSNFRWVILTLLFVATTILYIDRSALGILAPELQETIGWNEQQYGLINTAFMVAYALCFLVMGSVVDFIGTKRGYLLSIGIWSIASVSHILARSWIGFAVSRFSLAIGQSGNFPSAIKAVAEWFPVKERALAIGIFNGGSNMGTILAPLLIPPIVLAFDNWKLAFVWTFPISLAWMILWVKNMKNPSRHKRVNKAELEYIESDSNGTDESQKKIKMHEILPYKGTWVIALAKFIADPIWWFYIFWGAKFLYAQFGINLKQIGLPFFTIFLLSWLIGIFLGWLSSRFLKGGMSINKGRKLSLLACALFAVPVILVPHADNLWTAVFLLATATGGHCGWSANIFSLMSDIFPKKATASIAGFGGFSGAVGGALVTFLVGNLLQNIGTDGYVIPFTIAGMGYLIALGLIHLILPVIKPVRLSSK